MPGVVPQPLVAKSHDLVALWHRKLSRIDILSKTRYLAQHEHS